MIKTVLITGGTGFLGKPLVQQLLADGLTVTVFTRQLQQTRDMFRNQVQVVNEWSQLDDNCCFDAIINLAGAPIFGQYWTEKRKKLLRNSRILLTEQLVAFIARMPQKPKVLLSGSAIGVYGSQGDQALTEDSPSTADFAQQLCQDWEAAALKAAPLGVRVCLLRTGLVLGHGGGLLQRMLLPFRLGLGGTLGDGKQWMAWISLADWLAAVRFLLNHHTLSGAFNLTAPNPATNAAFITTLGKVLKRPTLLPVPAIVLRTLLGEMAELVLGSQRVLPERLLKAGFVFEWTELEMTLQAILQPRNNAP